VAVEVEGLDIELLRSEIQRTYAAVSREPDRDFMFPTGRAWAEDLGYPAELLARIPDASCESFAGVANPFSLGLLNPGERVLDLGCGAGEFAAALAAHEAIAIAVDAAPEAVRRAKDRGVDALLVKPDAPLPFTEAQFDAVWLGETLEHLVDPVGALNEVRRVLRPRGRLLATTPDHPPALLRALADDPRAFAEHFSPRADHLRFFNERSLGAVLDDLGFQDVDLESDGTTLFAQARW